DQCAHEGLAGAVTAAGDAAVIALEKTPEQLDVLADAGAVDVRSIRYPAKTEPALNSWATSYHPSTAKPHPTCARRNRRQAPKRK
ncbi:hypothetical protein OVV29_30075, partial [Klebsiella pneumoniae]|nr:hypothetical protein [Klebsiella pneumoniae]